jgi:predicted  nucleic acid-binding Zn-ribbon protein
VAGNIKGLTVEIGAETRGLEAALKNVGKRTNDINKELAQVERGLKFDPKNTVLLGQKQALLADKIAATKEKLDALKQAQSRVDAMYKAGEIDDGQYRAFQRDVVATNSKLKTFEAQLKDVDRAQGGLRNSTKSLGTSLKTNWQGVTAAAAGVVAAAYAVGRALTSMVIAGAEAEKAERTLRFAVERSGISWAENAEAIDAYIQKVSYAAAVDDEKLAVAQSKLLRITNDLGESQRLLGLATDISAATGLDLNTVTKGLTRAYGGNVGALTRMGIAVDTTKDKTEVFADLYEQFGGAAAYVSDNLISDADRVKIAWGNVAESAGEAFGPEVSRSLNDHALLLQLIADKSMTAAEKWGVYWDAWGGSENKSYLIADALGLTAEATEKMTDAEMAAAQATADLNAAVEEEYALLEDLPNVLDPVEQGTLDMYEANIKVKKAQEDVNAAIEEYGAGSDEALRAQLKLEEAKRRQVEATGQVQEATEHETRRLAEMEAAADKAAAALRRMQDAKLAGQGQYRAARASGGPVVGGQTYLVGEEGPELFTAPRSGTIIPTLPTIAALSGGSAGGTSTTNLSVNYFTPVASYSETVQAQRDLMGGLYR